MDASSQPDQVAYVKQVRERGLYDDRRFLERLRMLAKLGNFRNKKLLDVGCGFGWHAFCFSLLGGNSLVGVDILPGMIDGMNESISAMKAKGVKFDSRGICGDICETDLEPHSFDVIYSIEAIEHVHDLAAMFARCRELLKPDGKLVMVNDNNVFHRETREKIVDMWQQREHSWDWVTKLKNWRPVEHADAKPFAVMREEIVRAANPKLGEAAVTAVVEGTPGLLKIQIEEIARSYKAGFEFPELDQYDRCRNPETGEYAERLLDPFKLASMLRKEGFRKTEVRHYFRKFPYRWLNGIQFPPLNKYLFGLRSSFIVVGQII